MRCRSTTRHKPSGGWPNCALKPMARRRNARPRHCSRCKNRKGRSSCRKRVCERRQGVSMSPSPCTNSCSAIRLRTLPAHSNTGVCAVASPNSARRSSSSCAPSTNATRATRNCGKCSQDYCLRSSVMAKPWRSCINWPMTRRPAMRRRNGSSTTSPAGRFPLIRHAPGKSSSTITLIRLSRAKPASACKANSNCWAIRPGRLASRGSSCWSRATMLPLRPSYARHCDATRTKPASTVRWALP
ncbi:hypothetical protein D3C81_1416540 [compost metagenome]